MGFKKVFNLRRSSNNRGVVEKEWKGCEELMQELTGGNAKETVDAPVKAVGESKDAEPIFPVNETPHETTNDKSTKDECDEDQRSSLDGLQVFEVFDMKNDCVSNVSTLDVQDDENTAFEILTVSSSKDYGSIFSGLVTSDSNATNTMESTSTGEVTDAFGSLITSSEGDSAESDKAVGPEILLTKDHNSVSKNSLNRFFSVVSLIEGRSTLDETDCANASESLDTNSLEDKSSQTSSAETQKTADETESESTSVAIAQFGDKQTPKQIKTVKTKVTAPSTTAANRDAKKKVVAMMIDNFKSIAGKGACFCDNNCTEKAGGQEEVYDQPEMKIDGIFSRDVEDTESQISCTFSLDSTAFSLDSMANSNRMYL